MSIANTTTPPFSERTPCRNPHLSGNLFIAPESIGIEARDDGDYLMSLIAGRGMNSIYVYLDRHDAARLREIADELEGGAA